MSNRLNGKVAVVTGSGQGIGRAVALAVAEEGARVITNNRQAGTPGGDAETVAREIRAAGGEAVAVFADVSNFESARELIQAGVDHFGRVDILLNIAANVAPGLIYDMTEEDWDSLIAVHLKGTFNTCRHATPLMKAQGSGRIVNTASDSAYRYTLGSAAYSAAKGGVISLTRAIARDMARYGVTCNAICPQAATRLGAQGVPAIREWYEQGTISKPGLRFLMSLPGPEFVAPFYVYLATDEAAGINGRTFRVGAGQVALLADPFDLKLIQKDHKTYGAWTLDELTGIVPVSLAMDLDPVPPYPPRHEAR